jgi:hypothetical protein
MTNQNDQFGKDAAGKSRAELDQGFKAYRSSLKADYCLIKERALLDTGKKEIGYHVHMSKQDVKKPAKK